MKTIAALAFALLCAASAFAQAPAAKPIGQNLIFEGNFTEHADGTPAGWQQAGFAGGDHGNRTKVTEDRDGNYVTLFVEKPASANFTLNLKDPVPLRPTWTALLCSVDIRVYNYQQGAQNYYKPRMQVTFLDDAGKDLGNVGVSLPDRYTEAWQTAERTIPIPAGATVAKIWIGTFGATGQLEFRNPYLAPAE